jgi:hypothetical protein
MEQRPEWQDGLHRALGCAGAILWRILDGRACLALLQFGIAQLSIAQLSAGSPGSVKSGFHGEEVGFDSARVGLSPWL